MHFTCICISAFHFISFFLFFVIFVYKKQERQLTHTWFPIGGKQAVVMVAITTLTVVPAGQVDTSRFTITLDKAVRTLINIWWRRDTMKHPCEVNISRFQKTVNEILRTICLLEIFNVDWFTINKTTCLERISSSGSIDKTLFHSQRMTSVSIKDGW